MLVVPRTMGDFLGDFDDNHLNKLNLLLSLPAMSCRKHLERHLQKRISQA